MKISKRQRRKLILPAAMLEAQTINPRQLEEMRQVGRIAFREQGEFWNAYYALPDTMTGAIFLGCIRFVAVRDNEVRKQQFIDLMRAVLNDIMRIKLGKDISWKEPIHVPKEEEK